jgi:hypothetical protein
MATSIEGRKPVHTLPRKQQLFEKNTVIICRKNVHALDTVCAHSCYGMYTNLRQCVHVFFTVCAQTFYYLCTFILRHDKEENVLKSGSKKLWTFLSDLLFHIAIFVINHQKNIKTNLLTNLIKHVISGNT